MKKNFTQAKKLSTQKNQTQNSLNKKHGSNLPNTVKKNTTEPNNTSILNYFFVSTEEKIKHPISSDSRQQPLTNNTNQKYKDPHLSKFKFTYTKKDKNIKLNDPSNKKIKSISQNMEQFIKIDVSKYVLFSEKFSNSIALILSNNFLNRFRRFLTEELNKNHNQEKGAIKNFNNFIQKNFSIFITKYFLNIYNNLLYVPRIYITNNKSINTNQLGLLSRTNKTNITLDFFSPINLNEATLFYPSLCSCISDFIKQFKHIKKKYKKKQKTKNNKNFKALVLYRPNEDFRSFISKIELICNSFGFELLIREDDENKLMNFDKLKEIRQNKIIGSLKEKSIKYLELVRHISNDEKWKKFINENFKFNSEKNNKKDNDINKNNSEKNSVEEIDDEEDEKLSIISDNSHCSLTFLGHDIRDNIPNSQDSWKTGTKIFENFQQNILNKFDKRRNNIITFVDPLYSNEEINSKYITSISCMVPNSKSPIIILTNNLSLFIEKTQNFLSNFIFYCIENEGINQKENIIYTTLLIIYFLLFIPKLNEDDTGKFSLELIKNNIEKIYTDPKKNQEFSKFKIFEILYKLSHIITIINNYEYENILVYLTNIYNKIRGDISATSSINLKLNCFQKIVLENIAMYLVEKIDDENLYTINIIEDDKNVENNKEEIIDLINDDNNFETVFNECENKSFNDYEYGNLINIASKEYNSKKNNFFINNKIDNPKEIYFYTYNYSNPDILSKNKNILPIEENDLSLNSLLNKFYFMTNSEFSHRIIEDHKFFQTYYSNSINAIWNYEDIAKFNDLLNLLLYNEKISLEDISKFFCIRYSKRKKDTEPNNKKINNKDLINDKLILLNRIFIKSSIECFNRYIKSHNYSNYYVTFDIGGNIYKIPNKLTFYNYFSNYYLIEKIQNEIIVNDKYNEKDSYEDEDENDDDMEEEQDYDDEEY